METENLEQAKLQYQAGKAAFERGDYRQSVQSLEKAVSLVARNTRLGGEMQVWLVTAYEAAGQQAAAIDLCEQISRHPDYTTRKQGKRLLYILRAPRLKTRPEWLTQIPDLGNLEAGDRDPKGVAAYKPTASRPRRSPPAEPEPVDLSQVNTQDNQFIWVALGAIALVLGSLFWLGFVQ